MSRSIAKRNQQNAIISVSRGTANDASNESVHLIGNMTGRKQRRVAAAMARWIKRKEAGL
ncbi:hypothetical protein [Denitrificimonas caeni]|uniref:Uncharacterized protein n=1 Tax=Denitrificimonas caeni TaxID=521720 RepID=A0AAE9VQW4_9GAMM|nr:hypothetical protein [Denitrificimonas caeni]WBE26242.1 hypothetical protein O6P33_05270 [Denitrificimonas caeni]